MRKNAKPIFATFILALALAFVSPMALPYQPAATAKAASSVKLNKTKVSLKKGQKYTLKALRAGKTKIKWKSSSKKIASVSSKGVVTAKSAGTCTVTANIKNKKLTCKVMVKKPVLVKKLKLDKTYAIIRAGCKKKLKASISPKNVDNKNIKWTSSNSKVASVSADGTVTAKKKGVATITAAAKDGSKKKASCKIVVQKKKGTQEIPMKDRLEINRYKMELFPGKKGYLAIRDVSDGKEVEGIIWKSLNSEIASVNTDGVVTGETPGKTKIYGTLKSDIDKEVVCNITVLLAEKRNLDVSKEAPLAESSVLKAFTDLGFVLTEDPTVLYSGFTDAETRSITVKRASEQYTVYHELGHFVSFCAGNTCSSEEFGNIYLDEKELVKSANKVYVTSDSGEYFAHSYADYILHKETLMKERPKTYAYIVKAVGFITDDQVKKIKLVYGPFWENR